jgi:hypothetical protein
MRPAIALATVALTTACLVAPSVGPPVPGGGVISISPTFSSISEVVLVPKCATSACHSGNPPANAPVSLDADRAWQELVGVPSTQAGISLVEPGSPGASYLVNKVRGTQGEVGGLNLMPLNAEPLSEDEILAIEAWITNGAPND